LSDKGPVGGPTGGPVGAEQDEAGPVAVARHRTAPPERPSAVAEWRSEPASEASVRALSRRLADYTRHIENLNIAEYVELVRNPRRMFILNFISGIGRGFGIAVGFTLLGALVVLALQRLVMLNLPGIGGFIAEIVRIVQGNLRGP